MFQNSNSLAKLANLIVKLNGKEQDDEEHSIFTIRKLFQNSICINLLYSLSVLQELHGHPKLVYEFISLKIRYPYGFCYQKDLFHESWDLGNHFHMPFKATTKAALIKWNTLSPIVHPFLPNL